MILYGYSLYSWLNGLGRKVPEKFAERLSIPPKSLRYHGQADYYDITESIVRRIEELLSLRSGEIRYTSGFRSLNSKYKKLFDLPSKENFKSVGDLFTRNSNFLMIDFTAVDNAINFKDKTNINQKVYILLLMLSCIATGQRSFFYLDNELKVKVDELSVYKKFFSQTRVLLNVKKTQWRGTNVTLKDMSDVDVKTSIVFDFNLYDASQTFIKGYNKIVLTYPKMSIPDVNTIISNLSKVSNLIRSTSK